MVFKFKGLMSPDYTHGLKKNCFLYSLVRTTEILHAYKNHKCFVFINLYYSGICETEEEVLNTCNYLLKFFSNIIYHLGKVWPGYKCTHYFLKLYLAFFLWS